MVAAGRMVGLFQASFGLLSWESFCQALRLNVVLSEPLLYVPLQLPCLIVTVNFKETDAPGANDLMTEPE